MVNYYLASFEKIVQSLTIKQIHLQKIDIFEFYHLLFNVLNTLTKTIVDFIDKMRCVDDKRRKVVFFMSAVSPSVSI